MRESEKPVYDLKFYDYDLPEELIAQTPAGSRDGSRLLALDRQTGRVAHHRFRDLGAFLKAGDLLVVNDTRVVPARLHGCKQTGGRVEVLVLDPYKPRETAWSEGYECLIKSSKPLKVGSTLELRENIEVKVLETTMNGRAKLLFPQERDIMDILAAWGEVPLPPYIKREASTPEVRDTQWYQTVYAGSPGAVAAPTAGLHFTTPLLDTLRSSGVEMAAVTLHVGYGTFSPIRTQDLRHHTMHSEQVEISEDTAAKIRKAGELGRRIIAVGTTVVRAIEWAALKTEILQAFSGPCDHYIYPGYAFKVVDAMITNFHLPQSSLILLVSAFAGRENILRAYETAVSHGYRFFSYGDAMLIA